MLVFLIIVIYLLTLLVLPIRVGFNCYLDLFGNDGFIKVYVFGIRIFKASLNFEHNADSTNNIVINHGNKHDKIHLSTDPKDKKSVAAMMKNPAFSNVLIDKLSVHFTAGKTNDAFFTVALLQGLRVVFYSMLAALKCRYDVKITESFTPVYERDILQTDFIGIINISIADIIVSLLVNKIKTADKRNQEVAKV